ncbi:hypothetical protein G6F31_019836 [Rhizopus arrhizus]|nr:hypothetical protein G6F31_019836 [Rhizopus arrhizus]
MPRKAPTSTRWPRNRSAWRRSWPPATRTPWKTSWTWPPMHCACRRGMPWSESCPVVRSAAWRCAACCCRSRTCCCSTNRPTTSTPSRWSGWNSSWRATPAPSWRSPMIATSWTTPPSGSWNWTAAAAFRGRATTPTG